MLQCFLRSPLSRQKDFCRFVKAQPETPSAAARLSLLEEAFRAQSAKRTVGVLDGVFDLTHVGHYAAIKQAKKLVDHLIVLVNGDVDTEKHKGPLVYNERERRAMIAACKWVDEVHIVEAYHLSPDVLTAFNADYILHGDDPVFDAAGNNIYEPFVRAGRFKMFKRTHGVSTTDIVDRILNLERDLSAGARGEAMAAGRERKVFSSVTKIAQFFESGRGRPTGPRVGLTLGAFDLLNFAHVGFLEKARSACDFLIVGLHEDAVVRAAQGEHFPVFTLTERMLNLLSLRSVDDVVLNAPPAPTPEFLAQFDVTHVFYGKNAYLPAGETAEEAYAAVRDAAQLVEIDSEIAYTLRDTIERVKRGRTAYEDRLRAKQTRQEEYYRMDAQREIKVREVL